MVSFIGQVQLASLHLGFLQTEEVGIHTMKDITETLAFAGSQSVDIPRDEFHKK